MLSKKYGRTQFNSILRTAYASVTGALQSCSADAFNVLLHPFLLDLHIKCPVACRVVKLWEPRCWTATLYGHSNILDEIPREIWSFPKKERQRQFELQEEFNCGLSNQAKAHNHLHRQIKDGQCSRCESFEIRHCTSNGGDTESLSMAEHTPNPNRNIVILIDSARMRRRATIVFKGKCDRRQRRGGLNPFERKSANNSTRSIHIK